MKRWSFKRWCRWLDNKTGYVIHRGRAQRYYDAGIAPSAIMARPFVLNFIIPAHL